MRQMCKSAKIILGLIFIFGIVPELVSAEPQASLRVGVLVPLTGPAAEYGIAIRNGILLAQESYPDLRDQVEFLFEDSKYEATQTLSGFERLTTIGQATVVFSFGMSEAIAPVAERKQIWLFANTAETSVAKDRPHVIRFFPSGAEIARSLLTTLRAKDFRRLGMIVTETPYTTTLLREMLFHRDEDIKIEVIDSVTFAQQDFRTTLVKTRNKKIDALGAFIGSGQIGPFYRQMQSLHLKMPTFGTDFFESESELTKAGPSIEAAIYIGISVSPNFAEQYKNTYSNDRQMPFGGNGYDFALVVKNLLNCYSHASNMQQCIITAAPVEGAGGLISFVDHNSERSFKFPLYLKQVHQGKIKTISRAGA